MEDPVSYMDLPTVLVWLWLFFYYYCLILKQLTETNRDESDSEYDIWELRYGIQNTIVLYTMKNYSNTTSNNPFSLDWRYTLCPLFCTEESEVLRVLGSRLSPSSHEASLRLILAVWVANPYSIGPFTHRRQMTFWSPWDLRSRAQRKPRLVDLLTPSFASRCKSFSPHPPMYGAH